MNEHISAFLAGILFCLPACVVLLIWARWPRKKSKTTNIYREVQENGNKNVIKTDC